MVVRMLRFKFYIPRALEDSDEVREIEDLLNEVKTKLKVSVKKFVIDEKGEDDLKYQILWGISVAKRIKIKQTRKSKSLYPQRNIKG